MDFLGGRVCCGPMRGACALFGLVVVLFAGVPCVSAQDADPAATTADLEARGLFAAGEAAYAAGRFEDAYTYFQHAYELSPRPALLYNLGLAAASAGHEREAVAAFERYLSEVPDAPNRVIIEARLTSMRAEIAEEEAVAARLAAAEAASAREASRESEDREAAARGAAAQRDTGWAVVVGGGALLAVGVVLFGIGAADVAAVEGAVEGTPWPSVSDAAARAPVLTGVGLAAGATGLAALGVGLGLALSASSEPATAASAASVAYLAPVLDPSAGVAGLAVGGTF